MQCPSLTVTLCFAFLSFYFSRGWKGVGQPLFVSEFQRRVGTCRNNIQNFRTESRYGRFILHQWFIRVNSGSLPFTRTSENQGDCHQTSFTGLYLSMKWRFSVNFIRAEVPLLACWYPSVHTRSLHKASLSGNEYFLPKGQFSQQVPSEEGSEHPKALR